MKRFWIPLLYCFILLAACKHEPVIPLAAIHNAGNSGDTSIATGTTCSPDTVYFENEILPLFRSQCAMSGCHTGANPPKGILLDSYASLMASGEIVPFNASKGDIMESIQASDPSDVMPRPPASPLSAAQISRIRTWINQGAHNNYCDDACDTSTVTYSMTIAPLLQNTCTGCHNNNLLSGGVNLSAYGGVQTVALNGRLDGAVNHLAGYQAMPQGGNKLSDCNLAKIRIWIDAGAPAN